MARLVFLRRTAAEVSLTGGEVYFDINGKNVGRLAPTDCFVDLPAGTYQIRMYKSHNYNTMVGFASVSVTVSEGESLMLRYTPPAVVSQPGNIQVSNYTPALADEVAQSTVSQIEADRTADRVKAENSRRGTRKAVKWIIIGSVATGVLIAISWIAYFAVFMSIL